MKEKEREKDEEQDSKSEDKGSSIGSPMELRKVRKATAKKRILDKLNANTASEDEPQVKVQKKLQRKKKPMKTDIDESDVDEDNQDVKHGEHDDSEESTARNGEKVDDSVDQSETNTMTLEQFTDIVLASEGLSVDEQEKARRQGQDKKTESKPVVLEPISVKEENNNKTITATNANEMVANLMQNNNDLIVEVKKSPGKAAKPVVLSPRQPPGSHLLPHHYTSNVSLSSSVVVSVKPRVHPVPPQNKPPKIPHLVEEWFSKMQPPLSEKKPKLLTRSASVEALNLSTKVMVSPGKTTQVYLRPIPTPPKLVSAKVGSCSSEPPSVTISPKLKSPIRPSSTSPGLLPKVKMSPPRLEITKVNGVVSSALTKKMGIGRTSSPFESAVHMESVRARAVRDVQFAHSKDMHGNYPIHMSVLMRKADLVRRYCCILQILESPMDLLNEDLMTPLHLAIRDHSTDIAEILLSFGSSPLAKDKRGNTGVHLATASKDAELLRLLVKGLDPKDLNLLNDYGLTPLHIATMNDDVRSAEVLIKYGADVGVPDALHGLTPLALAKEKKLNNIIDHMPKKNHVEIPSR